MWGIRADLASSDVLDSFSGLMVGLCCESDASDLSNIGSCNVGSGVSILPCAGLGIIRSIDQIHRIFYALTPAHPHLLSNVTSFVGGSIGLPLECVQRYIFSLFSVFVVWKSSGKSRFGVRSDKESKSFWNKEVRL
jgi:hypothetical protein